MVSHQRHYNGNADIQGLGIALLIIRSKDTRRVKGKDPPSKKCKIYLPEWSCKKYVGSTEHVCAFSPEISRNFRDI